MSKHSNDECKHCKLYVGNCGHHHVDSDGHINYDIPAIGYVDKYGWYDCFVEGRTMKQLCITAVEESDIIEPYKHKIVDILRDTDKLE